MGVYYYINKIYFVNFTPSCQVESLPPLISQAAVSILLSLIILVQSKDEGLSATFNSNQSFQAIRRGPEKVLFVATIILAILFVANALAFVFVR